MKTPNAGSDPFWLRLKTGSQTWSARAMERTQPTERGSSDSFADWLATAPRRGVSHPLLHPIRSHRKRWALGSAGFQPAVSGILPGTLRTLRRPIPPAPAPGLHSVSLKCHNSVAPARSPDALFRARRPYAPSIRSAKIRPASLPPNITKPRPVSPAFYPLSRILSYPKHETPNRRIHSPPPRPKSQHPACPNPTTHSNSRLFPPNSN
jgi:hypothetical protein